MYLRYNDMFHVLNSFVSGRNASDFLNGILMIKIRSKLGFSGPR